jgi:hypothetical protein
LLRPVKAAHAATRLVRTILSVGQEDGRRRGAVSFSEHDLRNRSFLTGPRGSYMAHPPRGTALGRIGRGFHAEYCVIGSNGRDSGQNAPPWSIMRPEDSHDSPDRTRVCYRQWLVSRARVSKHVDNALASTRACAWEGILELGKASSLANDTQETLVADVGGRRELAYAWHEGWGWRAGRRSWFARCRISLREVGVR